LYKVQLRDRKVFKAVSGGNQKVAARHESRNQIHHGSAAHHGVFWQERMTNAMTAALGQQLHV
jgi:hypothetical protein